MGEQNLWISPNHIGGNAFNLLVLAYLIISLSLFTLRRHHFPIKGRGYAEVVVTALFLVVQLLNTAVRGPSWPCLVCDIIQTLTLHLAVCVYFWRVSCLLVQSQMSSELQLRPTWDMEQRLRHVSKLAPRGWLYMRSLLSFRNFALFLLAYIVVTLGVFLGAAFSLGRDYSCEEIFSVASLIILFAWTCPSFIWLAWKLRKYPRDGMHLKTEFQIITIVVLLSISLYVAIKLGTSERYPGLYLLGFAVIGIASDGCLFPVALTFRYSKFIAAKEKSLDLLLSTPSGLLAFLEFLKKEFSAENLIFYIAVTDYKAREGRSLDELRKDALHIRDTFVVRNSPYQVNNSAKVTEKLLRDLSGELNDPVALIGIFDDVLKECFNLMRQDSFPRFCDGPAGKEFIAKETQVNFGFPRILNNNSHSRSASMGDNSNSPRTSHQPILDSSTSYKDFLPPPSNATLGKKGSAAPTPSVSRSHSTCLTPEKMNEQFMFNIKNGTSSEDNSISGKRGTNEKYIAASPPCCSTPHALVDSCPTPSSHVNFSIELSPCPSSPSSTKEA